MDNNSFNENADVRLDILRAKRLLYESYPPGSKERKAFVTAGQDTMLKQFSKVTSIETRSTIKKVYLLLLWQEVTEMAPGVAIMALNVVAQSFIWRERPALILLFGVAAALPLLWSPYLKHGRCFVEVWRAWRVAESKIKTFEHQEELLKKQMGHR